MIAPTTRARGSKYHEQGIPHIADICEFSAALGTYWSAWVLVSASFTSVVLKHASILVTCHASWCRFALGMAFCAATATPILAVDANTAAADFIDRPGSMRADAGSTEVRFSGGTFLRDVTAIRPSQPANGLTASPTSTIELDSSFGRAEMISEPVITWVPRFADQIAGSSAWPEGASIDLMAGGNAVAESQAAEIWFTGRSMDGLFVINGSNEPLPVPEARIIWAALAIAIAAIWLERRRLATLAKSIRRKIRSSSSVPRPSRRI